MSPTNNKPQAADAAEEQALLSGRVSVLYALSQYYLFLPFAALCMAATIAHRPSLLWLTAMPFVLQIVATVVGNRLKKAFDNRPEGDDPKIWLRRFTILSGAVGAVWGFGAVVWFVPNAFPAQAYLCLAFLGMTATEFIVRAAYRPAYLAHAACSLGPLAVMLFLDGSSYAMLSSVLVMFFGGVLYSYCDAIGKMIDDSVRLRHDNVLLIARLSHEKRDAEVARDAARASERAKSAFFATISHEIRTPLNAILGMTQLLERSELQKTQRDYVKVLLEAGRGLTTLLDDVIDLSRRVDQMPSAPEGGCDAAEAVRTVASLLQPNAWEKQLRLTVKVADGLPRVAADPRQLRRALLKLAGNAIKFTDKGHIEISVDPLSAGEPAAVRFRVADTGPGIAPEIAPTLFDAFARTDDSYARRHNGAGVGLTVAKRIIESMGGAIGVESRPGTGALFWFTVPAAGARSAQAGQGLGREPPPPPVISAPILRIAAANLGATRGANGSAAAIDAEALSDLEKSLGSEKLSDILQAYLTTAEGLAVALARAAEAEDREQTGRLARDFAGAAGGLGLVALTAAARLLAQISREGKHPLSVPTQDVLAEHRRVKEVLRRIYPDLAA